MDQIKIGSFLKELRLEKGLTQGQLAERKICKSRGTSNYHWSNANYGDSIILLIYGIFERKINWNLW